MRSSFFAQKWQRTLVFCFCIFFFAFKVFVLNLAHFADVVGSFCLLRRQKIRNNNKKEFRLPSLEVFSAFKKRFLLKKEVLMWWRFASTSDNSMQKGKSNFLFENLWKNEIVSIISNWKISPKINMSWVGSKELFFKEKRSVLNTIKSSLSSLSFYLVGIHVYTRNLSKKN